MEKKITAFKTRVKEIEKQLAIQVQKQRSGGNGVLK